ncbi:UNVERIFIED_ORG: hypothetical protein GGE63_000384 [Rhizobium esperanzae]
MITHRLAVGMAVSLALAVPAKPVGAGDAS